MPIAYQHQMTREDMARAEIGHTDISRAAAWGLTAAFLLGLFGGPAWQVYREVRDKSRGIDRPGGGRLERLQEVPARWRASAGQPVWRRVRDANALVLSSIHETEEALDAASWLTQAAQPAYQAVLYRLLGVGNEKAYAGRDGWLFFRPEVDYLTGPGFLEPRHLNRRAAEGSEWMRTPQPDPVKGILDFHRQLRDRDIHLVLLPIPAKPSIHPGKMLVSYERAEAPLQNPSFAEWVQRLEAEGVQVLDPADRLWAATGRDGVPAYLATDTHWRPESMDSVARWVAETLAARFPDLLPQTEYRAEPETVTHYGDTLLMLALPETALPPPETVRIQRVLTRRQELWRPAAESPVLLLGDSFCNIYSLPGVGGGGPPALPSNSAAIWACRWIGWSATTTVPGPPATC